MSQITIDNKKESSVGGQWSNPGASLYDKIMDSSNWQSLLKETYLVAPVSKVKNTEEDRTSFSASDMGYPHHVIRGGKLVIHRTGLRASYSRAAQQGIVSGEVEAHLIRHYKEMGWYKESTISGDDAEHGATTDDSVKMEADGISKVDKFLEHYGVPGMQWGVRRFRGSDGRVIEGKYMSPAAADKLRKEGGSTPTATSSDKAKATPSSQAKPPEQVQTKTTDHAQSESQRLKSMVGKSVSDLSNADIRFLKERVGLEQDYKRVVKEMKESAHPVQTYVKKMVKDLATQGVKDFAQQQIRKLIEGQKPADPSTVLAKKIASRRVGSTDLTTLTSAQMTELTKDITTELMLEKYLKGIGSKK